METLFLEWRDPQNQNLKKFSSFNYSQAKVASLSETQHLGHIRSILCVQLLFLL